MEADSPQSVDRLLDQAWQLLQIHRVEDAVQRLHLILANHPDESRAHSILALALLEQEKIDEAQASAERAVRLEPMDPLHHVIFGEVRLHQNRATDARAAGSEALRLDPTFRDAYALLARAALAKENWPEALKQAEAGLAHHAEDPALTSLRIHALTQLGRRDEASAGAASALAANPESASGHANAGWAKLHANDPKSAIVHFKEALRLNPGHEYARAGLVEALKARNPVYRLILGFFLWMQRLSPRTRIGVIIGGYIAYRLLGGVAANQPALKPLLVPLIALYMIFVVLTWVSVPLFNLLLRLSPSGRHALTAKQTVGTNLFGAGLVTAVVIPVTGIALMLFTNLQTLGEAMLLPGAAVIALLLPLSAAVSALGSPRQKMFLSVIAGLYALLALTVILTALQTPVAAPLRQLFFYALIASLWGAAIFGSQPTAR